MTYRTSFKRQGKPKIGLYDLGRLPVVKLDDPGRPSLKKFQREWDAEVARKQQEEMTRGLRQTQEQLLAETRDIERRVRSFYSLDLGEMGSYPVSAAPTDYVVDFGQPRTGPRNAQREAKVYWTFRDKLGAERGTTLTQDGWNRLGSWVAALAENASVEPTAQVWEEGLHRLTELQCFHDGELFDYQPRPKPAAQPQPAAQPETLDAVLDRNSTESREGRAECLRIVEKAWGQTVRNFANLWFEDLRRQWNFDLLAAPNSENLVRKMSDFIMRWSLDPLSAKTFNKIRVAFSKEGLFLGIDGLPRDLRLPSELLEDTIESADLSDRSVRMAIGRRNQELIDEARKK